MANAKRVSAVGCISHTTIGTIEMRPIALTYCCAVVGFDLETILTKIDCSQSGGFIRLALW